MAPSSPGSSRCRADGDTKIAFLAGGIGVTPFRSMVQELLDKQTPRPIVMLYGNNSATRSPMRDYSIRRSGNWASRLSMRSLTIAARPRQCPPRLHRCRADRARSTRLQRSHFLYLWPTRHGHAVPTHAQGTRRLPFAHQGRLFSGVCVNELLSSRQGLSFLRTGKYPCEAATLKATLSIASDGCAPPFWAPTTE